MEQHSKKLYVKLFITSIILLFALAAKAADESGLMNANLMNFMTPQYNKKTQKLECIITGTDAKTVGSAYLLSNVVLKLIGKDGKSIQAVITTPKALYNQATGFISGNKWIKLQALEYDAQGVGFDASQITETLHIRNDVKLTIKNSGNKSSLNMGTGPTDDGNSKPEGQKFKTKTKETPQTATAKNIPKNKSDIKNNLSQTPEDKANE
ncbi:MAG: LPS export ABC transporter periplasmic protein LptC [bacterium]|nr:LPS export ABC transporter periplasmic protein LptC [bacterium]